MRDFIFDNFEEEEKDFLNNNNNKTIVKPVVETIETTEEKNIIPSVTLDKLTDEQEEKLLNVLGKGINKILHDLCSIDDDYLPF